MRAGVRRGGAWAYSVASKPYRPLSVALTPGDDNTDTPTPSPSPSPSPSPDTSNPENPTAPSPSPAPGWTAPTVPAGNVTWVNPATGSDDNPGTQGEPVATVAEAWRRVPQNTVLTTSHRILLQPGTYPSGNTPHYWENRWGTPDAPIVLEAVRGPGTVTLQGDINMFNTRHFWLKDVDIVRNGDAFHCEQCENVTISGSTLAGNGNAHETVKVNQSEYFNIVNSDVSGAGDNPIDFVAVQHGVISGNKIHDGGDWCAYVKGGSAYIHVVGNEIYDCGTGGFTAGQGTGFEFMTYPWLRYETYGVTVVDNIVHDTWGAGLGVNGGYNTLLAYNTLYRVGTRSHLVEFVHGSRSCDGDTARCAANRDLGGWGTTDEGGQWIPSKHVFFLNNVIYNPSGVETMWQHFTVANPTTPSPSSGVPSPSRADDDLRIHGNIIWNGGPGMSTGLDDPTNLLATNSVNAIQPDLVNPAAGDYRPTPGGVVATHPTVAIPPFSWVDAGVPSEPTPTVGTGRPPGAQR